MPGASGIMQAQYAYFAAYFCYVAFLKTLGIVIITVCYFFQQLECKKMIELMQKF